MANLKISGSMLRRAVENILKSDSIGLADVNIDAIHGVIKTGEAFEIESLEVSVAPKAASTAAKDRSGHFTPPAGAGKIRLAAVDGEVL